MEVEITANSMGPGDEVTVAGMYDNIRSEDIHANFLFHAALPQQVILKISSSANTSMSVGYWFTNQQFPAVNNTIKLKDNQFGMAQFIQTQNLNVGDLYEVSATDQVAFSAAAPYSTSPYDFLNVFLFDGTGDGKQLLGSLYSAQNRILLSHSKSATLMYVMKADDSFVGTVIANDDGNLASCASYSVSWINTGDITNGYFQTSIGATNGQACLTLLNKADGTNAPYLVGVTQQDYQSLYAGVGAPGGTNLAVYRNRNTNLPQFFPGFARTFVATQETYVLNFTFDPVTAKDHVPYPGRTGFFMTKNFAYLSNQQSTSFYLNSTSKFNFTFNVGISANAPGALMNVYGTKGLLQKIDLSNVSTSASYTFADTLIDLDILDAVSSNTGYYVTYRVADVAKDQISCPGAPANMNRNIYLPLGIIPPNFNCSFVFLLQTSDFADLTLNSYNIGTGEKVEVQYLVNGTINNGRSSNFSIHAAFPPMKVTILVQSGASTNMHFGYNITRRSITYETNVRVYSARSNDSAQFIQLSSATQRNQVWMVETDTDLSLISSSPFSTPPLQFLNIFVSLGISSGAPIVSTLYDLYKQPTFVFSQGVTIYYAMTVDNLSGTIVANAASNLKNCPNYYVQWSFEDFVPNGLAPPNPYQLTVDATQQTTCVTILNSLNGNVPFYAPYFKSVDITNSGNATIIVGAPSVSPLLLSTLNPPTFTYPQLFPGFVRTIVLNSGVLKVNATFDPIDAGDHIPYPGRSGFIATENYGFTSYDQPGYFWVNDTSAFNFTFSVQQAALAPGAYVNVFGESGLRQKINLYNISNTPFSFADTFIDVSVLNGKTANTGAYITYQIFAEPKDVIICPPNKKLNGQIKQPLGIIPANFECRFTYLIDSEYFAELTLNAYNIGPGEVVEVRGATNDKVNNGKNTNYTLHASFPPNELVIYVKSGAQTNMHLGFTINRKAVVFNGNPIVLPLGINKSAQYIHLYNQQTHNTTWKITAEKAVRLAASGPSSIPPVDYLNIFVYQMSKEGLWPSMTLYSLYNKGASIVTTEVILYFAMSSDSPIIGTVIANEDGNADVCGRQYVQWAYQDKPSPNQVVMDATQNTICLTILNDYDSTGTETNPPFFKSMDFQDSTNSAPMVLVGAPILDPVAAGTILGTMANPSTFSLPQFFPGFVRTIILTSGILKINLTFDAVDAGDSVPTIGRNGFIASDNYMFNVTKQDAHFALQSSDTSKFNFSFMVTKTNAPSNATVTLYGTLSNPLQVINLSNQANWGQNFSFVDSLIAVTLDGGSTGVQNLGTMLQYSVTGAAAAGTSTTPTTPRTSPTTTSPPKVPATSPTTSASTTTATSAIPSDTTAFTTMASTTPIATTTKTANAVSVILSILVAAIFF